MPEIIPALEIPLGHYPPEVSYLTSNPNFRKPNPLGYRENLLATRGLDRHIACTHRDEMKKTQNPEDALLAVYGLFGDIDRYIARTQRILMVLEKGPSLDVFALAVSGITMAKMSTVSRDTGEWPGDKKYNILQVDLQDKLLKETGFGKLLAWGEAERLLQDNIRFLLHESASVGENELVQEIGYRIQTATAEEQPTEETVRV